MPEDSKKGLLIFWRVISRRFYDQCRIFFCTYLHHYADRNLEAISTMLTEEVHLRDWNLSVFGRLEVLRETARNFTEAKTIEINILAVFESQDMVAGELHITVDKKIDLYVVDVLTFDLDGKISAIRSYKGRGD